MKILSRLENRELARLIGLSDCDETFEGVSAGPNPELIWNCHDSFHEAEIVWRALESSSTGSVYQRFDWCSCWFDVFSKYRDITPMIITGRVGETVSLLLPLYIQSSLAGARVARFMGDDHANIRVPLLTTHGFERFQILQLARHGGLLTELQTYLRSQKQADLLDLASMPVELDGDANPFANSSARPSEVLLFSGTLDNDFESLMAMRRPAKSQSKTRRSIRQLEKLGPLSFESVSDPASLDAVLDLFFDQKRGRLNKAGVRSAFALEANQMFLRQLASISLAQDNQTLELYALKVGEVPVAIAGGGRFNQRFSTGINSMTADPAYASHGPGRISVDKVVERLCGESMALFDLGLGENEYKRVWCDPASLVDVMVHLTAKGFAYRCIAATKRNAVRMIRASPLLLRLAQRARLELQRFRSEGLQYFSGQRG